MNECLLVFIFLMFMFGYVFIVFYNQYEIYNAQKAYTSSTIYDEDESLQRFLKYQFP